METFGHELRRLADAAGLSLGKLARRAHYDKSYVVKVATGAKRPSPQLAEALDAGSGKKATEHLDSAIGLGSEAGDPNHLNHGLSYKAYAALLADQPGMAACLSAAARRDPRVHPSLRAYDAYQEALARATEKDSSATDHILGEANELAAVAAEWKEAAPPGFYWYSPAFMHMQHGLVLLRLGQPARAAVELGRGMGGLSNQYRQAEWTVSYSLPLAIALAQTGDVEQAATAARVAAKIARETGSDLLLHKLTRLQARLPKLPAVSELGDLLHVL